MDYEKKYKEAQKWIESIYSELSHEQQMEAEAFFPELKESEDERIRKAILTGLIDCRDAPDLGWSNFGGIVIDECIAWLEKQGEQNHADKIEPKFKVGDWVVQGYNILKIRCVGDEYYCFETVGGYVADMLVSEMDSLYHLWTIQDAKDGDVLATEDNCICIFDNTVEEGKYPFAYCGLSMYGFKVYDITLPFTHDDVYPATKEQRDLLFQKMKEAGYEWDADKKELKKIEQKPYGQRQECVDCQFNYAGECKGSCAMKRGEQKPAWSEEDEVHVNSLLKRLEGLCRKEFAITRFAINEDEDWLKSLKDRYTWKPSEEQMKALHDLNLTGNISYAGQGQVLIELYNDLKKLAG